MLFLYKLGIRLYYLLVLLGSPLNKKASYWIRGRKGTFSQMRKDIAGDQEVAWFHASSLGEFEQGRPLIEGLRHKCPKLKIILTFFSPSGYEIQKNYQGADHIYYLPLDTRKNAQTFLQIAKPKYAIFIKYEFWYHFLKETHDFGAQLILISALFRPEQLFFKKKGSWYRNMLKYFEHIFVQDEKSLNLLHGINITQASIAGDTRFDRVVQIAEEAKTIEFAEDFSKNRFTYVFGSTWEKDEELILQFINASESNARYIIAPHEIHESHIRQIINGLSKRATRFSKTNKKELSRSKVLIIDNIGLLSSIYRYGKVAYIGGGFGKGIHNVLEPAVYGMPIVFGPNYQKFREAIEIVNEQGAFSVSDFKGLSSILHELEQSDEVLQKTSKATRKFVQRNLGATRAILNFLTKA